MADLKGAVQCHAQEFWCARGQDSRNCVLGGRNALASPVSVNSCNVNDCPRVAELFQVAPSMVSSSCSNGQRRIWISRSRAALTKFGLRIRWALLSIQESRDLSSVLVRLSTTLVQASHS